MGFPAIWKGDFSQKFAQAKIFLCPERLEARFWAVSLKKWAF